MAMVDSAYTDRRPGFLGKDVGVDRLPGGVFEALGDRPLRAVQGDLEDGSRRPRDPGHRPKATSGDFLVATDSKHLVAIDNDLLAEATSDLGASTMKVAVNRSLESVALAARRRSRADRLGAMDGLDLDGAMLMSGSGR